MLFGFDANRLAFNTLTRPTVGLEFADAFGVNTTPLTCYNPVSNSFR
jgi:hypothetical protein